MRTFYSLLFSFILVSLHAETPPSIKENNPRFLSQLSVGVRASTLGFGVQAATPINEYLNVRAGLDFLNFSTSNINVDLIDSNNLFEEAFGYTPEYKMKPTFKFTNANVLVDFHPFKGIFHLTGGFFLGKNQVQARGHLVDNLGNPITLKDGEYEWPPLVFDGHELQLDGDQLNADLRLGQVIKPYLGAGLGRAISKNNRLSFKFELGVLYQGDYALKQGGREVVFNKETTENFEKIDTYTKWLKWWPMMNFQLSYRIF